MNEEVCPYPVILSIAANDPTGAGGIQGDIETLASMGCHCAPIISSITIQDTSALKENLPNSASLLTEQATTILEDLPVAAIKIGLLGNIANIQAVHHLLLEYPNIPVIFDPELRSGGRRDLGFDNDVVDAMINFILPLTTMLMVNSLEARIFAPTAKNLEGCAQVMMEQGCEYVFISGTHESTPAVVNTLYCEQHLVDTFSWERFATNFNGAGCTLSAATAGLIAQGLDPVVAIIEAQEFTFESLRHGYKVGKGNLQLNRFFWAREEDLEQNVNLN